MRKVIGLLLLLVTITIAGVVAAESGAKDASRPAPSAGAPGAPPAGPPCPGGPGMCGGMGPGMHHDHGMMGHAMMPPGGGGFCPMGLFLNPAVKMDVKPSAKGATITLTADDPRLVTRIQKTLEIVRLMRDLRAVE